MASENRRQSARRVYEKEFYYKNSRVLSVHIEYPFAAEAQTCEASRRLARFYRRVFDSFRRYCVSRLLAQAKKQCDSAGEGEFEAFFAALTCTFTYRSGSLVSLFFDRTEIKGPHDRSHTRWADTWHLPSCRAARLGEFTNGASRKKTVQAVTEKLLERKAAGERFYPELKKRARCEFSSRRFYLTQRGLVVFYQPMTLQSIPDSVCEVLL